MLDFISPINILNQDLISIIRQDAAQAEKNSKLTKKQLNIVADQKWLKLLVPSTLGGSQTSLPDLLALEEALAYAYGSIGWYVTSCAGASWFTGFVKPEIAQNLLLEDKFCIAASGSISGTARLVKNKYIINGQWQFATGINDATALAFSCFLVDKDGANILNDASEPIVISFLIPKSQATIYNTWNAMGLKATGSHGFELNKAEVPANHSFSIQSPVQNGALYAYPMLQLNEATLAINLCGMAMRFMELCCDVINNRQTSEIGAYENREYLEETFNKMAQRLLSARQKLYYAVDMSWQVCVANKVIRPSVIYNVSTASNLCVNVIRECVSTLYPYCGLKSVDKDCEINRVLRDILTAGQHPVLLGDGSLQ